jgi:hypothetical protein
MMKCALAMATICVLLAGATLHAAELTAYYDFEGAGADRYDDPAGAFADDLNLQFNPAFSNDVSANALGSTQSASFDGNSVLGTDAYSTDLGPDPDAFTVMFWIKARDIDQENNNTRLMTTRVKPDGSGASNPAWQVEGFGNNGNNGDKMDMRANNGNLLPAPADTLLFTPDAKNALARADQGETTADWHHVTYVWANSGDPQDGGAYAQTWVDGVSQGISHEGVEWDGFNIANPDGQLIIGGHAENAGSRAFSGLLDDVALFAGIVDEADIQAFAAGTASPGGQPIPEPSTLVLAALGMLGLLGFGRRRRA